MRFPFKLWLKWTVLVLASAIASFIAALIDGYNTARQLTGIGLGIATFIVIYTVIESWATARSMSAFVQSLKVGVLIKIGLEIVPAIEVVTGGLAIDMIDALGIDNVILSTYLKTLIVGVIYSVIVFLLAALYWYLRGRYTFVAQHLRGATE
jgi:hypothetical protein